MLDSEIRELEGTRTYINYDLIFLLQGNLDTKKKDGTGVIDDKNPRPAGLETSR
jgi:hypothetical protein